jgi:hypothetical protein
MSHENFKVLGIYFSLDLNCITDINFTQKIKEIKAILFLLSLVPIGPVVSEKKLEM